MKKRDALEQIFSRLQIAFLDPSQDACYLVLGLVATCRSKAPEAGCRVGYSNTRCQEPNPWHVSDVLCGRERDLRTLTWGGDLYRGRP